MNAAGVPDGTWLGAQEQKENENAEDPIVVDEDHENGEDNSGLSNPDDEFVCDDIDRRELPLIANHSMFSTSWVWKHFKLYGARLLKSTVTCKETLDAFQKWNKSTRVCVHCHESAKSKPTEVVDPAKAWEVRAVDSSTSRMNKHMVAEHMVAKRRTVRRSGLTIKLIEKVFLQKISLQSNAWKTTGVVHRCQFPSSA